MEDGVWLTDHQEEKVTGEAAERVFAWEFNRSMHTIERGDPPRTGLLTMTGGWCYRTFIVGALIEVQGGEGQLQRAHLADPTGAFVIIPRQQGVPPASTLLDIAPPAFIALTGVVRMGGGRGERRAYIEPEVVVPVDRSARDRWVMVTAERTITRLEALSRVLKGSGDQSGATEAVRAYCLTPRDLDSVREMVEEALVTVSPAAEATAAVVLDPREVVLAIIASRPSSVAIGEVVGAAAQQGLGEAEVRQCLLTLLEEGECYSPRNGYIKRL